MKNLASWPLRGDLLLKDQQAVLKGFRTGRTTCYIDIHGDDLIDSLDHTVDIIHSSAVRTGAH
jgi:hypothetical protein